MNIRLTILLVVLVVIIGALVGITQVLRNTTDNEPIGRLYSIARNDILNISMERKGSTIKFSKQDNQWVIVDDAGVDDVNVDGDRWSGIVFLLESPAIEKPVSRREGEELDLGEFGLDPPVTKVGISNANSLVLEIHLGDSTPSRDGFYVKLAGKKNTYIINSSWADVVTRLITQPPYPLEETAKDSVPID